MTSTPPYAWYDRNAVRRLLTYDVCIPAMRQAMIGHSSGQSRRLLRSFLAMGPGRTFAQMPGAVESGGYFGAKLVSVFADPDASGRRAHRGVVILFDGKAGAPLACADAEAITHIRTAAASAAATDALARPDAATLAVIGAGGQAEAHVRALLQVRPLTDIVLWSRTPAKAEALAAKLNSQCEVDIRIGVSAEAAAREADIICTVTASTEPVLLSEWVSRGAHVNLVGSSGPGPREVDSALLARSRFFGDCRDHVFEHGAEFIKAREEGLIGEDHFLAEIGAVFAGERQGRCDRDDITVYKSLGHAVQDLAALATMYERDRAGATA